MEDNIWKAKSLAKTKENKELKKRIIELKKTLENTKIKNVKK
jgi:hypothetical protein